MLRLRFGDGQNVSKSFQKNDCPTISVDTKKKENIGEYKNNGREYNQKSKPEEVSGHDFMDKRLGKVAAYGIYDIGRNKGWVSVGISGDTAAYNSPHNSDQWLR